ncbi:MAG TPA: hypothetical protein DD473_03275 [Planctomycetaceae bacterium]|nr:hypothetical protein [Planctomycetaceae bacterium]
MIFSVYLAEFDHLQTLRDRVELVLTSLPEDVQLDFLEDPRFRIALENYEPGKGWSIFMETPGPVGSGSRCVVLRPKLDNLSHEFACYVIAHEFAHAFLRNGGWGEITDEEQAADSLAAHWGYPRP